jgi:hypothetical protein
MDKLTEFETRHDNLAKQTAESHVSILMSLKALETRVGIIEQQQRDVVGQLRDVSESKAVSLNVQSEVRDVRARLIDLSAKISALEKGQESVFSLVQLQRSLAPNSSSSNSFTTAKSFTPAPASQNDAQEGTLEKSRVAACEKNTDSLKSFTFSSKESVLRPENENVGGKPSLVSLDVSSEKKDFATVKETVPPLEGSKGNPFGVSADDLPAERRVTFTVPPMEPKPSDQNRNPFAVAQPSVDNPQPGPQFSAVAPQPTTNPFASGESTGFPFPSQPGGLPFATIFQAASTGASTGFASNNAFGGFGQTSGFSGSQGFGAASNNTASIGKRNTSSKSRRY